MEAVVRPLERCGGGSREAALYDAFPGAKRALETHACDPSCTSDRFYTRVALMLPPHVGDTALLCAGMDLMLQWAAFPTHARSLPRCALADLDTACRSLKHAGPHAGPHADVLERYARLTGRAAPEDDAAQRDAERRQFNAARCRPQGKGFA